MRKSKYKNQFQLGQKFGKWSIKDVTVVSPSPTREAKILCQCECGFEKLVHCLTLVKG